MYKHIWGAVAFVVFTLMPMHSWAQVTLQITDNELGDVGTMAYRYELQADGGIVWYYRNIRDLGVGKSTTEITESYDARGMSLEDTIRVKVLGGVESEIKLVYDKKGVTASFPLNPLAPEDNFPLPGDELMPCPNVFWFVTVVPEKGERITYYDFSSGTSEWSEVEYIYMGKMIIEHHGKTVSAHHVRRNSAGYQSDLYLDDRGYPYYIKWPSMEMRRVP